MPEPCPWEPLYDAVALGMSAYGRLAFRVERLGSRRELGRSELVVATHRAETDVPLICDAFYWQAGVRRRGGVKLHFAARDDMFERGFFAGFPPGLPAAARTALPGVRDGGLLGRVRVHPLPYPSPDLLRLGRALAEVEESLPLTGLVPESTLGRFRSRARERGRGEPRVAGDVLRGDYADLLWEFFPREELAAPAFAESWRRRRERAVSEIRALVEVIRSGEPLLVFPEGRPSPGGEIGPLRGGTELLIRRGRPERILPVGLAYDPFTRGRPRVGVTIGEPFPAPEADVEPALLAALRHAVPLMCGQVVCTALVEAAQAGEEGLWLPALGRRLERAAEEARAGHRELEHELGTAESRQRRLDDCVGSLIRAGLLAVGDRRSVGIDPAAVLAAPSVLRSAREYESARSRAPG